MPLPVSDLSSNAEENIAHAAKIIGRADQRRRIFDVIYTGKRRVKSAQYISSITGIPVKRVLTEGKRLSDNRLAIPAMLNGRKAYQKIDFFHTHKRNILFLASSPEKLKAYPTKRNPAGHQHAFDRIRLDVRLPRKKHGAALVTVDDIDSFAKVRSVDKNHGFTKMAEGRFKKGVAAILGESGPFKDWGGESRDLSSTRVVIAGKRHSAAFAFKGPGKVGRLTPGKMGKNGDQIQRLVKCPADVFIVQYWAQIDDSVLEQLENFARLKSYLESRAIRYGVIDGIDSTRLIKAYPKAFGEGR